MATAHAHTLLTETEYLDAEAVAPGKSEFVDGGIYAMAGASERHNRISLNIALRLHNASRGKPCRAFMSDMKLRLAEGNYYYPDALLVCDPADDHPLYKQSPCFIAEVLSPATRAVDLREKRSAYLRLQSLTAYLVADAEARRAQVWFRDADGRWLEQDLTDETPFVLDCPGVKLAFTLDDLYEDTGLPLA